MLSWNLNIIYGRNLWGLMVGLLALLRMYISAILEYRAAGTGAHLKHNHTQSHKFKLGSCRLSSVWLYQTPADQI